MPIQYKTGDATQPNGTGPRIIVHVCNDIGGWGRGFVLALSNRWPQPEAEYRDWFKRQIDPPFELGQVQMVEVEPQLWVANLIGQRHIKTQDGVPPIRYDAVRTGLTRIAEFAQNHNASVHMPRIGCGLAGGQWSEIETIVDETLCQPGLDVTVYDLA